MADEHEKIFFYGFHDDSGIFKLVSDLRGKTLEKSERKASINFERLNHIM